MRSITLHKTYCLCTHFSLGNTWMWQSVARSLVGWSTCFFLMLTNSLWLHPDLWWMYFTHLHPPGYGPVILCCHPSCSNCSHQKFVVELQQGKNLATKYHRTNTINVCLFLFTKIISRLFVSWSTVNIKIHWTHQTRDLIKNRLSHLEMHIKQN